MLFQRYLTFITVSFDKAWRLLRIDSTSDEHYSRGIFDKQSLVNGSSIIFKWGIAIFKLTIIVLDCRGWTTVS